MRALCHDLVEYLANLCPQFLQISSVPPSHNHLTLILNIIGINTVGTPGEPPRRFHSRSVSDLISLEIVVLLQTLFRGIKMNAPRGAKIVCDLQQVLLFWQL